MKVGLAQLNPKIGAVHTNLIKVREVLEKAKTAKLDLVVFPELTFLGYPARDLLDCSELIESNLRAAEESGQLTKGFTAVFNVVEKNETLGEKPLFNVAQVWQNGKLILKYRKKLFPYYDVFDEERHFQPGKDKGVFQVGSHKVGLTICEDIWGRKGFEWDYHGKDITEELINEKLDLLVNLSASPFHMGKPEVRETLANEIAKDLGCAVLYCDQVGANDELIFDGSSFIVDKTGKMKLRLPAFSESFSYCELESGGQIVSYPKTPAEWHYQALTLGIRDYFLKTGQSKAILGLSGGIDSSVVVAIAANALGPQNIKAVALPSKYNLSASLEDAKTLASNLGVDFQTVEIEPLVQAFLKQCPVAGLALENIQPRLRMTVLMAIANQENRVLLNTSNKSEIACGYATLYGDTSGALSVIGDLKKHEVYSLARFINTHREVIPERVITRAPSAELRENQTDQDSLPPYDVLDKIVELYLERRLSPSEVLKSGVDQKSWDTFTHFYRSSEYKRRQLPPVLRVSQKAFGMGRRIPVVSQLT